MKEAIKINFLLTVSDGTKTEFLVDGNLEEKTNYNRITFKEPTEDKALTCFDIYRSESKIVLNRLGELHTKMEYIPNEETIATLKTNFGFDLSMNCKTKLIEKQDNSIIVIYQTETDIEQNEEHQLTLSWEKII